jgi:outer membrane lipoprotein-sorting protein
MDMVSDGKTWKLWIPPRNRAMEGTSQVTKPSKNGLENLRPAVFFDSLLVRGPEPDEIVSLTSDIRLVADPKKKNDLVEEPDYDLQILSHPQGQTAHTHRVIHINRTNLLPYQQDIYDDSGDIVTRATYSNYQNYGDIPFPSKIVITRPIDQYSLTVTITKLTLNQKLDNDQFEMKIPDTVPIQKMD